MKRIKSDEMDVEPVISPDTPVPSEEKTVIGKEISIEGTVKGKEDLLIEGAVKGSIELAEHHLTVGLNGQVESDVQAKNVTMRGRVTGNVNALEKVSITKEAEFNGEIHAKSISIEDGAYLKAMIELEKETQKKNVHAIKWDDKAASDTGHAPTGPANETDKAT